MVVHTLVVRRWWNSGQGYAGGGTGGGGGGVIEILTSPFGGDGGDNSIK